MDRTDLLVQMLTCADARIALEGSGHRPQKEIVEGRDTGRIEHALGESEENANWKELVLFFEGGEHETVVLKGLHVD